MLVLTTTIKEVDMDTGYYRQLSRKSVILYEYIPKSRKPNKMIHKLRIALILVICLMQIAGIKLTEKSLMLSRTSETALITTKVINDEYAQIILNKESSRVFLKESCNTYKQATL